jgi:hypothetical protein
LGSLGDISGAIGANSASQSASTQGYAPALRGERGVDILWALRPMVSAERAALIDMVVQIYTIGKILTGVISK